MIPEFSQFTKHIEEIYNRCKENNEGKVWAIRENLLNKLFLINIFNIYF